MLLTKTKFIQIGFLLGLTLIILGLFLLWFAVGDIISINSQPLVLKWSTIFTQTGGRVYIPSIEQDISIGFFALFGAICLMVLRVGKFFPPITKWLNFGIALFLFSISVGYHISIWMLHGSGEYFRLDPPRIGLYVFSLGSFIISLISLLSKERINTPLPKSVVTISVVSSICWYQFGWINSKIGFTRDCVLY